MVCKIQNRSLCAYTHKVTMTVGYQSLVKFLEECINCPCFVVYLQSIVLLYCELWQNRKPHTFNMHGWWIKHEMAEWRNRRLEQCLLFKSLHAMNRMRCDHSTRNKTRNVSLSERNKTQNKRIKCGQNTCLGSLWGTEGMLGSGSLWRYHVCCGSHSTHMWSAV